MTDRNAPLDPTGDDPFEPGALPDSDGNDTEVEPTPVPLPEDPSYERDQDPQDRTGGSSDPHNSLGHADSGNETESSSESH